MTHLSPHFDKNNFIEKRENPGKSLNPNFFDPGTAMDGAQPLSIRLEMYMECLKSTNAPLIPCN
jgi:hypothetical protein